MPVTFKSFTPYPPTCWCPVIRDTAYAVLFGNRNTCDVAMLSLGKKTVSLESASVGVLYWAMY